MTSTLFHSSPAAVPPEPPGFHLSIDPTRGEIRVRGELDRVHVHQLDDAIDMLRATSASQWSIDVAEITFCDTCGLRSLLRAQQVAVSAGCGLVVTRPSRMLTRLLALVGLDSLTVIPEEPGGARRAGARP